MDWPRAIERNREALLAIVAALVVMVENAAGRVPRGFYLSVTRVLGPAEAAVRRLIVIAAMGLKVEPGRVRVMAKIPPGQARRERIAFRLFDPRKSFAPRREQPLSRAGPRIHVFGPDPRLALFRPAPQPEPGAVAIADGLIDARRLRLRLDAVTFALGDLPRQARRLARWRARRQRDEHLRHRSPLRPGPPPGHRRRPRHDVDLVLKECHGLAWDALALDTS